MRYAIFYHSRKQGQDRVPVPVGLTVVSYVRAEVVDASDLEDALDKAAPRPDEAVMNTHEIIPGAFRSFGE
jgi:hypothetical protein